MGKTLRQMTLTEEVFEYAMEKYMVDMNLLEPEDRNRVAEYAINTLLKISDENDYDFKHKGDFYKIDFDKTVKSLGAGQDLIDLIDPA